MRSTVIPIQEIIQGIKMAEEINKLLDKFLEEIRQAFDYLFCVIYDDAWEHLSSKDKDTVRLAKKIYEKHFVS